MPKISSITFAVVVAALPLAGCMSASTPTEAYLNRYAAAETVMVQCPAYGGYASASMMANNARTNLAQAKALGATDKDLADARGRVDGAFVTAAALTNIPSACGSLINSLAMAGTTKPVIAAQPARKKK